jgi:hypothetical protein
VFLPSFLTAQRGTVIPVAFLTGVLLSGTLPSSCSTVPRKLLSLSQELAREQAPLSPHKGPRAEPGETGPGHFTTALWNAFDMKRAEATLAFTDGYYREPANEGFEAVLDHLASALGEAGYGREEWLELEFLVAEEPVSAWTPIEARLTRLGADGGEEVLLEFSARADEHRTMLPANAPSADVTGLAVFSLADVTEGSILVTDASLRQVLRRARSRGAAAVLSCSLEAYNDDPSGARRHMKAIQYTSVRPGTKTPVAQVTRGLVEGLRRANKEGHAQTLHLFTRVHIEERPLRTLCATIRGAGTPGEAVVLASHVQEPGACDNASGVAGLLESACSLAELILDGKLERPRRSLVFLWGDEFQQSEIWLDTTDLRAVGAISSDMIGQSKEKTGAIALLERTPDPGALVPLPPDEHTLWGAGDVDEEDLVPNGLAVMARCAIADVSREAGSWETAEHPWEGGSDHDIFLNRGIPAILFWHFTDFAYHTSLDRLEHVDMGEVRRMAVAILATALALADPRPADLERYLDTVALERSLRVAAAVEAEDEATAEAWNTWSTGARHWLRAHCLNLAPETGPHMGPR